MHAMLLMDTESYLHARVMRTMLESVGFPAVAGEVKFKDGHDEPNYFIAVSAPESQVRIAEALSRLYVGTHGAAALDRVNEVAARPNMSQSEFAVPSAQRDEVRNALLHFISTAAGGSEFSVTTEPALPDTTHHDSGDEHTPKVHNPAGGGWDSRCIEDPRAVRARAIEDDWDNWKPARDVG